MRIIVLIGVVGILLACGRSQQPDEKETAPPASPTPTATALVPEQEGQAPQSSGFTDEPQPNAQLSYSAAVDPSSFMLPSGGQVGLNERAFNAAVIARASLLSTNATAENIGTDPNGTTVYRGLLEFKFKVLEYLKGTGGYELVVFVTDQLDRTYATMELALEAAQSWKRDRDTRWDDREALIFAEKPVGSSGQVTRYSFGPYGYIEAYTLDSGNRVWLPSVSSSAEGSALSGGLRFLLEEPGGDGSSGGASGVGSGQTKTVSVSEMNALIAKLEKWQKDGEGVEGYLECIRTSFAEERYINGKRERGESLNTSSDYYLDSGLPARTLINRTGSPRPGKTWLGGKDKDLFADANGPFITMRPLRNGTYLVYRNYQWPELIPCDYFPTEYIDVHATYVHVTAPAGTLHEAFFDPVTVGTAIAADSTNGVLKPTSFTDGNSASATLQSIAWKSPSTGSGQATVELKLTPHTGLANHVLDFIALDGSVILSLDADEATVDAANNTLSWSVSSQPWKDGDKLMLRVHDGP